MLLRLSHSSNQQYPKMMHCPKQPQKPKSHGLLRLCVAHPSKESVGFGFLGFFLDSTSFWIAYGEKLGQLGRNALFSNEIQHSCKVQRPNPNPTYSYDGGARIIKRVRGIRFCFCYYYYYFGLVHHFQCFFLLESYVLKNVRRCIIFN